MVADIVLNTQNRTLQFHNYQNTTFFMVKSKHCPKKSEAKRYCYLDKK